MPHGRPCLRSSVALPLGINGTRRLFIMAVSIQSRPKPAGPKATSVAGLRCGRLRPARFCEPQKFGPAVCRVRAARSPGGPKAQRAGPAIPLGIALLALSLRLRPVSASLRLRCRSAAFAVARRDFISILLTAKRAKSLFKRAGDGRASTALRPGGPRVPAVGKWLGQPNSSNHSLSARHTKSNKISQTC